MRKLLLFLFIVFSMTINSFSQNGSNCISAEPFCSDQSYSFPMGTGTSSEAGPDYGCLYSQPNPYWYYLQVDQSGNITIYMESPTGNDIDFICWGPFASPTAPCTAQLTATNTVDCSYSSLEYETCNISSALTGQYYLMLITNYSNATGDIVFNQTDFGQSGAGSTDCSIITPCNISSVSTNVSACAPATNTYSVSGSVTFNDQPSTGQLIVTNSCTGSSVTMNAPFLSPASYSFSGIQSNSASCTITASFTDASACTFNTTYVAPPACSPCITSAGLDQTLCGLTTTLSATENPTDINTHWNVTPGISFSDINSPTSTITASLPGTYVLTWNATNNVGFSCTDDVTILFNQIPTSTFTISPTSCFGDNATITYTGNASSTSTYIWGWTNATFTPGNGQGPQIGSWSTTGNQVVTLSVIENGCTSILTSSVNTLIPTTLISSVTSTNVNCYGATTGTATVTQIGGTPPYSYQWSNGSGSPMVAGNYTVTIYDSFVCSVTNSIIITQPTQLSTIISTTNVSCFGGNNGTATPTTSGGVPGYSYIWSSGSGTNLIAGAYSVTTTDANGCSIITIFNITQPTQLSTTLTTSNVSCFGENDGYATVNVFGATPPYSYIWSSGSGINLSAGIYSVTISDNLLCSVTQNFTITEPTQLTATMVHQDVTCHGNNNGMISVTTLGGTPNYNYTWSHNSSLNVSTLQGIDGNTYIVTISDGHNCTLTLSQTIIEPSEVIVNTLPDITSCNGTQYSFNLSVIGGTPTYHYFWNGVEGSNTYNGIANNNITLQYYVIDNVGCSSTINNVDVVVTPSVELEIQCSPDSVCLGEKVIISGSVINGMPPYTISDDNGIIVFPKEYYPNQDINYVVYVTDGCGSSDSDTIFINVKESPIVSFSSDVMNGCLPLDVTFNINGVSNWHYLWNFGDNSVSYDMNPIYTYDNDGIFDVTLDVTSTNGCKSQLTYTDMITVYPLPEARFITNPLAVNIIEPTINFTNLSQGATNFIWVFGDGDTSGVVNPVHKYDSVGTYITMLIAITNHNCKDTAYDDVMINNYSVLYVPTAFSPDGDAVNDLLFALGVGIDKDNFSFSVYDRWGELIFVTNDFQFNWDGRAKTHEMVPLGVYVWYCNFFDTNGIYHEKSGIVTVIR